MKIKKVFDICKKRGIIYINQNENEEQWLSDGSAMYPICGLPLLTEENVCRLYDITDAQRDKIAFNFIAGNPPFDVSDSTATETDAEMWDISIAFDGFVLIPVTTEEGIVFIERGYLTPLSDMPENEMTLTRRTDILGNTYIVVKFGLIAYAFIAPVKTINPNFVNKLEKLYNQTRIALINSEEEKKNDE